MSAVIVRLKAKPINRWRGRSKYGAVKTPVDGMVFASKAEAARYVILKLEARVGLIQDLECQVSYELPVVNLDTGEIQIIGRYVCDFRYVRNGRCIIEDKKGVKTPTYKLKAKLMQAIYGITVEES